MCTDSPARHTRKVQGVSSCPGHVPPDELSVQMEVCSIGRAQKMDVPRMTVHFDVRCSSELLCDLGLLKVTLGCDLWKR